MLDVIKKLVNDYILPIISVVFLYHILNFFGIGCPIKYITGVSCPGCGMTRAFISLLKLNIKDAFFYHPLFPLVIIFAIVYFFKKKINKKYYDTFVFICVFLFIIIYLIRLNDVSNSIVVFNPKDGLIAKLISLINKTI